VAVQVKAEITEIIDLSDADNIDSTVGSKASTSIGSHTGHNDTLYEITKLQRDIAEILSNQAKLSPALKDILLEDGLLSDNGNIDQNLISYIEEDDDKIVLLCKKFPGRRLKELLRQLMLLIR
jgi:hypothetical protein